MVTGDVLRRLRRLFAYDLWANRETLRSLKEASAPAPRARRVMAHVVGAERLWLGRLERRRDPAAVWPEMTLEQCESEITDLSRLWPEYLGGLSESSLSQQVSYTNSKGEPWTSAVDDILTHVVLHSSYHRGQIASAVRECGEAPAYTDFIHAVRQRLVE